MELEKTDVTKKIQLIKDRWNWMVEERQNTTKTVTEIQMEADIKFRGWR